MFAFKSTALLIFSTYIALALAAPSPSVGALPSGDVKCGQNIYAPPAVDSAVKAGANPKNFPISHDPGTFSFYCQGSTFASTVILTSCRIYSRVPAPIFQVSNVSVDLASDSELGAVRDDSRC